MQYLCNNPSQRWRILGDGKILLHIDRNLPPTRFGLQSHKEQTQSLAFQKTAFTFHCLARHGGAGRAVSEDAGAAHSDGLHDCALAAGPGAWRQRAEATTHRHLAEHRHAHHATVLLHGEGVHAAQT